MTNVVNGAEFLESILAEEPAEQSAATRVTLEFTMPKRALLSLLDKASTVVPTRDVMPVLKCLQIDVTPQLIRVTGTDVQLTMIACSTDVAVTQRGVAVFPARKLLDIIKSATDSDVTIKVSGTTAYIVIGRASWSLRLQGGADFPPLPAVAEAAYASVERGVFLAAVGAVRYAASRDPTKVNLNIIDITDGKFTASDGARIQQVHVPDFPMTLRIPIVAVDDLVRLLRLSTLRTIHVGQSGHKLIFRLGYDIFIVNTLQANFPDLETTLLRPALENKYPLTVERAALLSAIRRVRINADVDSCALTFTLTDNTLTVASHDKVGNAATETIAAAWPGTAVRTLVLNHAHLSDMLSVFTDPVCRFKVGDDTKTRRSALLLQDCSGSVAMIPQMNSDWAAG